MHDTTAFENRLLSAARSEVASAAISERMSHALGLNLATPGGGASVGTGATAGKAATGTATASLTKATTLLVLSAVLVTAGIGLFYRAQRSHQGAQRIHQEEGPRISESLPTRTLSPSPSTPAQPPAPASQPAAPAPRLEEPAPPRELNHSRLSQTHRVDLEAEVKQEIGLLDAARGRLTAGQPRSALTLLTQYDRRFPRGTFAPEAVALRIEAYVAAGDATTARTLARRFLKEHHESPLADRVDHLTHVP